MGEGLRRRASASPLLALLLLLDCAPAVANPPPAEPSPPQSDPRGVATGEAGSVAPFDRGAASRSLASIDVSSCAEVEGPRGPGHVVVVIATDGGVSSVRVDRAPYEDTLVGACVAERFRGVRVPPFEGPAVTIGKMFRVD